MYSQDGSPLGITGPIGFDRSFHTRQNFHMDIIELEHRPNIQVFQKVAHWNAVSGFVLTRTIKELQSQRNATIQNKLFKVVTRLGMPYLREVVSNDSEPLVGNDRYEGFIKDLMDKIAGEKKFSYELRVDPKNHYGSYDQHTGKWDGIIGSIIEGVNSISNCKSV